MKTHLPQLDGLRGIAILIVVLGHLLVFSWGLGKVQFGDIPPVGVDLFFVLSGFLITNILLRAKDKPNYFRDFYARRALRTWPIYAVLLVFMFAIADGRIQALAIPADLHWQYFACYMQNLIYHRSEQLGPAPLSATWSLAVEEQFYLIWPVLVWMTPSRKLWQFLVPVILLAPVARVILPHYGFDPYINPLCRFDAMAMGSLMAVWMKLKAPASATITRVAAAIIGVAVLGEVIGHYTGTVHIMSKSFVSASFTAILALSINNRFLIWILNTPLLRFTGKISYCMYLNHTVAAYILLPLFPNRDLKVGLLRAALILLSSYAVATVSWYAFESQILRLKRYFESPATTAAARPQPSMAPSQTESSPALSQALLENELGG